MAGTANAAYEIKESYTPDKGSNIMLEKAAVTSGKWLTAGVTIAKSNRSNRIYNPSRQVTFRNEVRALRSSYVLLFDTLSGRGWLVDGASALLHITCAQLRDPDFLEFCDDKIGLKMKHAEHQRGGSGALETILKLGNERIVLWKEYVGGSSKEKTNSEGKIVEETEYQTEFWSLRDQMRENMDTLSNIFAHQTNPPSGVNVRLTHRTRLEGWSFRNTVDNSLLTEPKMCYLKEESRGWVEYIRSFNVVTLLGEDFEELMKPRWLGSERSCCKWDKVPVGRVLLTVSYTTLREIADKGGVSRYFPDRVTSDIR